MKTPDSGTEFGRLTFTGSLVREQRSTYTLTLYECLCKCGVVAMFPRGNLVSGKTRSCGCIKVEQRVTHGMSKSPEYTVWDSMVQRVTNPKTNCRRNYFDKGIDMDPRWMSFESFYEDMGPRPDGLTLERKDSRKGYWPSNCIWADRVTQNNNTSRNVFIPLDDGTQMTVAQACRRFGMCYGTYLKRRAKGLSAMEALTTPIDRRFSRRVQLHHATLGQPKGPWLRENQG